MESKSLILTGAEQARIDDYREQGIQSTWDYQSSALPIEYNLLREHIQKNDVILWLIWPPCTSVTNRTCTFTWSIFSKLISLTTPYFENSVNVVLSFHFYYHSAAWRILLSSTFNNLSLKYFQGIAEVYIESTNVTIVEPKCFFA